MRYSFFETETNQLSELPDNYYTYVTVSCIFWSILYAFSEYLLPNRKQLRKELTPTELKDLKSRVVSSVHALYSTFVAIYYLLNDPGFVAWNPVHWNDEISIAVSATLGYFFYDFLLIATHSDPKEMGGISMFIHHICASACLLGIAYYRIYQIMLLLFCLTEFTTPFVNARILLTKLHMQNTILYVINGIAMWLGFIVFRFSLVFLVPYILIQYKHVVLGMSSFTNLVSILGYIGMCGLNTLWTYKITKGVFKVIFNHNSSSPSSNNSEKDDGCGKRKTNGSEGINTMKISSSS